MEGKGSNLKFLQENNVLKEILIDSYNRLSNSRNESTQMKMTKYGKEVTK